MKAIESMGYVAIPDYKEFIYFNLFKGKNYRIKRAVTVALILLASAVSVFYFFKTGSKISLIIGGVLLLGMFMLVYNVNTNVKNHCKNKAKVIRAKQSNKFGKNGLIYELLYDSSAEAEENEYSEIFYDELETVYFAKNAIYLYIEKRSTIIIPKRNLNMSPQEALEFLKKYLPQKLVICS